MGQAESNSKRFKDCLSDLETAINSSKPSDEQSSWKIISEALTAMKPQLIAWGEQIMGSKAMDLGTVADASNGLGDLDIILTRLEDWLEDSDHKPWTDLQTFIRTREDFRSKLESYREYLTGPSKFLTAFSSVIEKAELNGHFHECRISAGRQIIKFANALNRAVQDAENETGGSTNGKAA